MFLQLDNPDEGVNSLLLIRFNVALDYVNEDYLIY